MSQGGVDGFFKAFHLFISLRMERCGGIVPSSSFPLTDWETLLTNHCPFPVSIYVRILKGTNQWSWN